MNKKKGLILSIVVLFLLVVCIVCFVPVGIEASMINDTIREYEEVSIEDFEVRFKTFVGMDIPIKNVSRKNIKLSSNEILENTNNVDIQYKNFKTNVGISTIKVESIKTNLDNISVYEGDKLKLEDLVVTLIYTDKFEKDISNEIKNILDKNNIIFKSKEPIKIDTKYGEININPNIIPIKNIKAIVEGIGMESVWYEGEVPSIDSLEIEYENLEKRILSLDEIKNNVDYKLSDNLIKVEPLKLGENKFIIEYLGNVFETIIEGLPRIKDIVPINKVYSLEGDSLESIISKINGYLITYEDNSNLEILKDDIKFLNKDFMLLKGENEFDIDYLGRIYKIYFEGKTRTRPNVSASKSKDEINNADYVHSSDTIFTTITKKKKGSGEYFLSHIVIESPNQIKGALSFDDFGGTREKATSASKRLNAILMTNGSYFSYSTGEPVTASTYIKNGQIIKDLKTNGKEVCLRKDGTIFSPSIGIEASVLLNEGVVDIWGTADPLLIQDGVLQDLSNVKGNSYPRCAIGMVNSGEYYIITAGKNDYKAGLSFRQLQEIFANLGCSFARSLDGGGSATLVFNDKLINSPAAGEERPVVDFLYFIE